MSEVVAGILAAGKGSRLGEIDTPKPMLRVSDRPMIENVVSSLYRIGFSEENIYCVIGHLGEKIIEHFGSDIQYLRQDELNGNAGAIDIVYKGIKTPENTEFLIIQGDDSEQIDSDVLTEFINFHLSRQADISILTTNIPDVETHRFEFVYERDGRIVNFIPRVTEDSSAGYMVGTFIFSGKFLSTSLPILKNNTPEGKEMGIAELIRFAIKSELSVFGYPSYKPYISINTPQGLDRARHSNK